jgi:alanine racemase
MAAPIYDSSARAWVDVDLEALVRNARWLAARARVPLLPMVKADAYGLGAVPVAQALLGARQLPIVALGVAAVAEAHALRAAGIGHPLVCFSPLWGDDLREARALHLTPSLGHPGEIEAWRASGGGAWQLSLDTGMARAGASATALLADREALGALRLLCAEHPPAGVWTHFHSADERDGSMAEQERCFLEVVQALGLPDSVPRHCENSAGILARDGSPWAYVRPGVALYGVRQGFDAPLAMVAHLRARVVDERLVQTGESVSYGATWRAPRAARIATIALGYADGYRRHLGNRGAVLLNGFRAPVVGRVTMDLTMLDVSEVPCAVGDVATALGGEGALALSADEVAAMGDLSPYELLTGLDARPPRRYLPAAGAS